MAEKQQQSGNVTLDFESWLIDSWEFEADGEKYNIEQGGTEVPADKADELIKASRNTEARLHRV